MKICRGHVAITCLITLSLLPLGGLSTRAAADSHIVEVVVPDLSETAQAGQAAFETYCAACHGPTAGGTNQGPPLVHPIYNPNHHADIAFVFAAQRGARAHHWRFGDMEPVPGVSDQELFSLIQYVRELQRANGIE